MVYNTVFLLRIDNELSLIEGIICKYLKIPTGLRFHVSKRYPLLDKEELCEVNPSHIGDTPYYPFIGLTPLMDIIDNYLYNTSSVSDLYLRNSLIPDGGHSFMAIGDTRDTAFKTFYNYIVNSSLFNLPKAPTIAAGRLTDAERGRFISDKDWSDFLLKEHSIIDNPELQKDIEQLVAIADNLIRTHLHALKVFHSHILKTQIEGKDIVIISYGEAGLLRYDEACNSLTTYSVKRRDKTDKGINEDRVIRNLLAPIMSETHSKPAEKGFGYVPYFTKDEIKDQECPVDTCGEYDLKFNPKEGNFTLIDGVKEQKELEPTVFRIPKWTSRNYRF